MYQPSFNSVLVEIDDKDAEWGGENNENMLGKSYSKGKVVKIGECFTTNNYPVLPFILTPQISIVPDSYTFIDDDHKDVNSLIDKHIMWNEGTEAGTTFEHDGKLYGFIYWWDIRGVKE